jgi:type III pantothenate kinase
VFALTNESNDCVEKTFRLKSFTDKTSDEYYILFNNIVSVNKFEGVIISSVVPMITSSLKKMFETYYDVTPLILGPGIKSGIQLKVDDPKSVGADIICDCAGAMKYDNECLIIDLGTATKYIYVKNNVFSGLSISPGVAISMKALVSSAALLPNIELVSPKSILGTNTISCMQSGIIYGAASEVDGMIDRIKEEIKNPNVLVLATGGLSKLIAPLCKNEMKVVENLTLEGLLQIYIKNRG